MKTPKTQFPIVPSLIAMFASLAVVPAVAQADVQVESFRFRGENANALVTRFDECGFFQVQVFASENVVRGSGPRRNEGFADAQVLAFDSCTGEQVMGFSPGGVFTIDQLDSAAATLPLTLVRSHCDETGCTSVESSSVELSVTWTGVGDAERNRDMEIVHSDGISFQTRFFGNYRQAEVTASLIEDGVDLLEGAETYGTLVDALSGTHIVIRE